MNKENFTKVLERIKSQPDCWDQTTWHCGTKHCFFGWAQLMAGKDPVTSVIRRDARQFLGLTFAEADYASAPHRTIEEFEEMLTNRDGYDRDGYNRDGYNRDGYDRDGYDRAGYNRDGYNRDGYDRDGYDRDGYNRDGYDRDGYDRDGYNRDGYNRDGLDVNNEAA